MTREELFRAVGEVREDQITEAETMKKESRPWRRYGALAAACLALIVTAASVHHWVEQRMNWESLMQNFDSLGEPQPGRTDAGGGDLDGSDYRADGDARPAPHFSAGVEIGELDGPGNGETMIGMSACLAWMSPEEIFAQDTVIFRGTVRNLRYFRIENIGPMDLYYTVATVEITDSIRGDLDAGNIYGVLYLGAKGYMTTSVSGVLEKLDVGDEAIFMPVQTGEDTGRQDGDAYFCYADLAELYLSEGIRFVFTDTGDGLDFDRGVYETLAEAETLDEVTEYIRGMLKTE